MRTSFPVLYALAPLWPIIAFGLVMLGIWALGPAN